MTWEELKEKAKEEGYLVTQDSCAICQELGQTQKIVYYKDGLINIRQHDNFCFVADHRTPEQMYQIMLALR